MRQMVIQKINRWHSACGRELHTDPVTGLAGDQIQQVVWNAIKIILFSCPMGGDRRIIFSPQGPWIPCLGYTVCIAEIDPNIIKTVVQRAGGEKSGQFLPIKPLFRCPGPNAALMENGCRRIDLTVIQPDNQHPNPRPLLLCRIFDIFSI